MVNVFERWIMTLKMFYSKSTAIFHSCIYQTFPEALKCQALLSPGVHRLSNEHFEKVDGEEEVGYEMPVGYSRSGHGTHVVPHILQQYVCETEKSLF